MAKYEKRFKGNFSNFKNHIQSRIMDGSASVSYDDLVAVLITGAYNYSMHLTTIDLLVQMW